MSTIDPAFMAALFDDERSDKSSTRFPGKQEKKYRHRRTKTTFLGLGSIDAPTPHDQLLSTGTNAFNTNGRTQHPKRAHRRAHTAGGEMNRGFDFSGDFEILPRKQVGGEKMAISMDDILKALPENLAEEGKVPPMDPTEPTKDLLTNRDFMIMAAMDSVRQFNPIHE